MLQTLSRCRIAYRKCLPLHAPNAAFSEAASESQQTDARPFEEIPHAKGLPLVGTLLDYTPVRGFKFARISDLWQKRHAEYGDIYREKIGGKDTVYYRNIANTETLFRSEGKYPTRGYLAGLRTIRDAMDLPDSMNNIRGEEWYKVRQPFNELFMKSKMVWKYAVIMQEVAADVVECIERKKDRNGEVPEFSMLMNKWAFENAGAFLFNTRLGVLEDDVYPILNEMCEGMTMLLNYVRKCMFSPRAKLTTEFKERLILMRDELSRLTDESRRNTEDFSDSVLGGILSRQEFDDKEKAALILDILFSSFETTSRATELTLYCLTLDSKVQDNLRNEVMSMPAIATGRELDGMVYTNAFLKEVNRLYPFTHLLIRDFDHDVVLSGYKIPAGTNITNTSNTTMNRDPNIFSHPDKFSPERWLNPDNHISRFAMTGPFGFGARSCPGRRFAMQEIHALLKAILSRYRVEYDYEPMFSAFELTGTLSGKPRFSFRDL